MHSIERYGIVALLFLVVTVVAVLMWDGGKEKKKKENVAGTAAVPALTDGARARAGENDAARRLSLVAESRPGPLLRQPGGRRAGASDTPGELLPAAGDMALEAESSAPGTTEVHPPAAAPARTGTPREEPARDPVVGRAPSSATHTYDVRSGDTLSEIAQRELGSARRWPEIVAANPGLDPARLRSGKTILIPGTQAAAGAVPKAETSTPRSAASGAKSWKVAQGENLWKIAERALGDGKRWPEIAALNPRANPDRLVLGQVLTLPQTGAAPGQQARATPKSEERSPLVASNTSDGSPRQAARGGKVR